MIEENSYKLIIAKLRGLRAEKGFNLEEVGKNIDIHRNTLSCYEKGTRVIPLDVFIKLLTFYGVNINIFFARLCDNNRN